MGSGSSTSVSPVKGSLHESSEISHAHKKSEKSKRPTSALKESTSSFGLIDGAAGGHSLHSNNNFTKLEKQVGQLESEKLDLQDQVLALEEQLNLLTEKQENQDSQECQNTIKAKDQYEQLLSENEALKLQLKKLRKHYKKRLRLLNVQMTETKHQMSIKVMELKEEISSLQEERNRPKTEGDEEAKELTSQHNGKTSIILALSTKVTEQEAIIANLEKCLIDAGHSDVSCNNAIAPTHNAYPSANKTVLAQNGSFKSESFCDKSDEPGLDELTSIVNEMKQFHKDTKRKKILSFRDSEDQRQSSGVSRDSGIISIETVLSEEERANDKYTTQRVSSATSAASDFSVDTEDDTRTECAAYHTPTDQGSIRRISAYKNKRKTISNIAQSDSLLNDI